MQRLAKRFYARDTLTVARSLLGQRLVRLRDGERLSGAIVEVEAYVGEGDAACHASRGRTRRNATMYGPPGHAYVYLIYGMYHCLNLVTGSEGEPAAVLIRGLEPLEGLETMGKLRSRTEPRALASGPGRLCQALDIDRTFNGADLCASHAQLFLEKSVPVPDTAVACGPRVGVTGDAKAISVPWRLYVQDSRFVSRR
jgi:DNA-3-methyladenine glycosylase